MRFTLLLVKDKLQFADCRQLIDSYPI